MTFDDLIRYKALNLKYISSGSNIIDLVDKGSISGEIPMKNVCAMITQELFDDLTNTCGLLDISKRQFIESAIIEALSKAQSIMNAEGLPEYLKSTVEA
jgi:Asp-tRNA(Asn)/Glu-tRNA(Gln) amidotransferase B subunit